MPGKMPHRDVSETASKSPGDPFVWPPRKPSQGPQPASDQSGSAVPATISPLAAAITQIERTWLGLVSPPWPIRVAEANWRADTTDDYCWRCGRTVGAFEVTPPESPEPGCTECRRTRPPWQRFIRLGEYTGVLREAILEIKFARWRRLGHTLGIELGRAIEEQLSWPGADGRPINRDQLYLVPIPAPFLRRMRMQIDHTLVLARGIRSVVGGRIIRPVRRRHGPSQLEVPPSQRQRNVAGSFRPPPQWDWRAYRLKALTPTQLAGATLIVIDDVKTTGATMTAACRAVLAGLASSEESPNKLRPQIWAATLGVTPERRSGDDPGSITDSLADIAPLT